MQVAIRTSRIRQDLEELYRLVRVDLQQAYLQAIADAPTVDLSEDALQRWRRHDTKNPNTIHLFQVAAYLGYRIVWVNDVQGIDHGTTDTHR